MYKQMKKIDDAEISMIKNKGTIFKETIHS